MNDSTASGTLPGGGAFSRKINRDGKPFDAPIHYGGRGIWWTAQDFGFGIEGTHAKAHASAAEMAALGEPDPDGVVGRRQHRDHQNIVTINMMKRWPGAFENSGFTPCLGAGIGAAIAHVDIQVPGAANRTFGHEMTGTTLRGTAGMKYDLNARWALFGEYQIIWSDNDITIDPDPTVPGRLPGKMNTEITTHAVNFGVSYSF